MDWPAAAVIVTGLSTAGSVIVAAIVRGGAKKASNGSTGVLEVTCQAKHAGLDASLTRIEDSLRDVHARIDLMLSLKE